MYCSEDVLRSWINIGFSLCSRLFRLTNLISCSSCVKIKVFAVNLPNRMKRFRQFPFHRLTCQKISNTIFAYVFCSQIINFPFQCIKSCFLQCISTFKSYVLRNQLSIDLTCKCIVDAVFRIHFSMSNHYFCVVMYRIMLFAVHFYV